MLTTAQLENLAYAADRYADEREDGPEQTYFRELATQARNEARTTGYAPSTAIRTPNDLF